MKSILIIGVGQFGSHVARRLNELPCEVMAIDISEERINEILPFVDNAQIGDCTNEEFMRSLGVRNYDVCIVSIGGLFQTSLEATALVKELGSPRVISRATNDVQMKFLLRNGADEVIYPEKQMAIRVATRCASDSILDFVQLDDSHAIYEMVAPKKWSGKSLAQLDVRKKFGINIIALKDGDKVTVPMADTIMHEGDIVFAIGEEKEIQKCFNV
ncbi:MAG: potassium channel family protein [Oscillospiraceae bacterium]